MKQSIADEEYGRSIDGFIPIGKDVSIWYIDESNDLGNSVERPYFILSAITRLNNPIDYDRAFEDIPLDYSHGVGEVHFSYLWKDKEKRPICIRLVSQVAKEDILVLEYPYLKENPRRRSVHNTYLDVIRNLLDVIDRVDMSRTKVIIFDETSTLWLEDVNALRRSDRYVLPAKSHIIRGLQLSDVASSSMGVGVNKDRDGKTFPNVFRPLIPKSINLKRWFEGRKARPSEPVKRGHWWDK